MNANTRARTALIALLAVFATLIVAAPGSALNQCITSGRTSANPYFEVYDSNGCPKVGYQARWNDYYGNLVYSAVKTANPALSTMTYHTTPISGQYSNLQGRGCSVTNAGSTCTLGAWYSSIAWSNFP